MIMALIKSNTTLFLHLFLFFLFLVLLSPIPSLARNPHPHVINFRSPQLFPEGLTWHPSGQHFLVGSLHNRTILSVSDAGVTQTLVHDPNLPENASILGVAIDGVYNRLLAVVHSAPPLPPFNALAAYDLHTYERTFLAVLDDEGITLTRHVANDVAVDFKGNAFVTNSAGNFIWKVNKDGKASVFSRSPAFSEHPLVIERDAPGFDSGLNGIAYISKGYLLVVQSNTGKMFKVDEEDGTARRILLNEDLAAADGLAIRKDGVVLAVSSHKLWFLKSQKGWSEGEVYDKTALDEERFATSVAVGGEQRVYVLYGHILEGIVGNSEREEFGIVEVRSEKEDEEDNVWLFVLIGLGVAYFLFWRFQMRQLISNMSKKIG